MLSCLGGGGGGGGATERVHLSRIKGHVTNRHLFPSLWETQSDPVGHTAGEGVL